MLGIVVFLVLVILSVVFYRCYMKFIQLELSVTSLDAQIAEKLHELRMKQLEIEVINLKLAELEKRCHIEKVR